MMAFDLQKVRAQFPILADAELHYLDNAATAQIPVAVSAAVERFDQQYRANVHGGAHRLAQRALDAYEAARATVAGYVKAASPQEIVFTYGTTAAINLVAQTFGEGLHDGDEIVVSELEHHSNLVPWQMLAKRKGLVLRVIPVTEEGRLDFAALESVVTERCRLIAVTHCSNVTGAVTDPAPLAAAARAVGAKLLLDGAQHAPHGPIDVRSCAADFYAFSGHKIYGPTGIGVLWARTEILEGLPPFMTGGQMIDHVTLEGATFAPPPRRFEAGTPPIAGAIGLGAALRWLSDLDLEGAVSNEVRLTDRLLAGIMTLPGARIVGPESAEQRRGVVSFCLQDVAPHTVGRALDRRGIAIRCGHHCAQPLMQALGLEGTARASLALYNDDSDVEAFISALHDIQDRTASGVGLQRANPVSP